MAADRIRHVSNGVELTYFNSTQPFENPLDARPGIVFTDIMNFCPNIEAVAMGVPVAVMPPTCEGLGACPDDELLTATGLAEFAPAIGRALDVNAGDNAGPIGVRARVVRDFGWGASLAGFDRLLDRLEAAPSPAPRRSTLEALSVSA